MAAALGAGAASRRSGKTARPRASVRRGGLEEKSVQGSSNGPAGPEIRLPLFPPEAGRRQVSVGPQAVTEIVSGAEYAKP
jgi:hypothetical protein